MSALYQLIDRTSGDVVVDDLRLADGFFSRLIGLQFRSGLPERTGLLLVPCDSIHTFWMRFSLDVVMLDNKGVVLSVRTHVRPWRIVLAARGTHAVLEVRAGSFSLKPGTQLQIQVKADVKGVLPSSLTFLQ